MHSLYVKIFKKYQELFTNFEELLKIVEILHTLQFKIINSACERGVCGKRQLTNT